MCKLKIFGGILLANWGLQMLTNVKMCDCNLKKSNKFGAFLKIGGKKKRI